MTKLVKIFVFYTAISFVAYIFRSITIAITNPYCLSDYSCPNVTDIYTEYYVHKPDDKNAENYITPMKNRITNSHYHSLCHRRRCSKTCGKEVMYVCSSDTFRDLMTGLCNTFKMYGEIIDKASSAKQYVEYANNQICSYDKELEFMAFYILSYCPRKYHIASEIGCRFDPIYTRYKKDKVFVMILNGMKIGAYDNETIYQQRMRIDNYLEYKSNPFKQPNINRIGCAKQLYNMRYYRDGTIYESNMVIICAYRAELDFDKEVGPGASNCEFDGETKTSDPRYYHLCGEIRPESEDLFTAPFRIPCLPAQAAYEESVGDDCIGNPLSREKKKRTTTTTRSTTTTTKATTTIAPTTPAPDNNEEDAMEYLNRQYLRMLRKLKQLVPLLERMFYIAFSKKQKLMVMWKKIKEKREWLDAEMGEQFDYIEEKYSFAEFEDGVASLQGNAVLTFVSFLVVFHVNRLFIMQL